MTEFSNEDLFRIMNGLQADAASADAAAGKEPQLPGQVTRQTAGASPAPPTRRGYSTTELLRIMASRE